MTTKSVLACVVCLLFGILGTWFFLPTLQSREAKPDSASRQSPKDQPDFPTVSASRRVEDVELMRNVVRQELSLALAEKSASAPAIAPSAGPEASPAESEADEAHVPSPAYVRAKAQVGERIRRGAWTEEDRQSLSSELGTMSDSERTEVMAEVIRATNQGKLRVEFAGPLFL